MGYAAGQPADAINLLRLAVLNFQFQFMRDVTLDGNVVRDGAFLVTNRSNDSVFSEKRAILLLVDETPAPHLAGADFGPQFPIKSAFLPVALEQTRGLADGFGTV